MFANTHKKIAGAFFMLCLVFVFMAAPFNAPAKADPISIIIAIVVAVTAAVVVDYFDCGFNIFFYCDANGNIIGSVGERREFCADYLGQPKRALRVPARPEELHPEVTGAEAAHRPASAPAPTPAACAETALS